MTKPFIYFVITLASVSLILSGILTIVWSNSKSKLKESKKEIKYLSDSLNNIIDEKDDEIKILENEIQEREIEIMYWGMKYDSTTWKR